MYLRGIAQLEGCNAVSELGQYPAITKWANVIKQYTET
jgi:hypothetical protein